MRKGGYSERLDRVSTDLTPQFIFYLTHQGQHRTGAKSDVYDCVVRCAQSMYAWRHISSTRPQTPLPVCCHLESYFKRPKSSPVRPLACNWYYSAQFVAKPKAVCALRFSWAAASTNFFGL